MSKNIVVLSDGTAQEGGVGHNTNVYKTFNMLEDRTPRQVAFYDRGLGTGWRKFSGKVAGSGISANICECYRFIFDHFESGDRIFLFGFSRGAATVRSLSSFIHHFGILPQSRPELIRQAYRIYRIPVRRVREAAARTFIRLHHTMWARIRFLGCYDTVAALGLPGATLSSLLDRVPGFRHRFHDFRLSASVEHGCHAVAIDDERKNFLPVLWDPEVRDYQTVREVWFPGMHSDVGGGYEKQALSDVALVWMIQKAVEQGLRIYPDHEVEIEEDAGGHMHDSRGTLLTRLVFARELRSWDSRRQDRPVVHASVVERAEKDGGYRPWILDLDHEVEPWVRYEDQRWSI